MNNKEIETEEDHSYKQIKKFYLEIDSRFKGLINRKRSDFVDLIAKVMSVGDDKVKKTSEDSLLKRFGSRVVAETNPSNSITVLVDGEVVMKK